MWPSPATATSGWPCAIDRLQPPGFMRGCARGRAHSGGRETNAPAGTEKMPCQNQFGRDDWREEKAAINRPQSRRFATAEATEPRASVWSADASAPLWWWGIQRQGAKTPRRRAEKTFSTTKEPRNKGEKKVAVCKDLCSFVALWFNSAASAHSKIRSPNSAGATGGVWPSSATATTEWQCAIDRLQPPGFYALLRPRTGALRREENQRARRGGEKARPKSGWEGTNGADAPDLPAGHKRDMVST